MELTRAVGENLKRIRKSKKLSMERLAAEAGVSRSMLGQIERGEANPSVGLLGKLAGALKVPAEVLLENDDFEPLLLLRELDNKAARLDGGKALLRPSLPYDDVLRQETFFLDLYISGRYAPEPMVPAACAWPPASPARCCSTRRGRTSSCWSGTPCGSRRISPSGWKTSSTAPPGCC